MSRYEITFPQAIPTAALADLYRGFTDGSLTNNVRQNLEAALNVVGYGAGLAADLIDDPRVVGDVGEVDEKEAFEKVGAQAVELESIPPDVAVAGGISPALILFAARFIIKNILPLLIK